MYVTKRDSLTDIENSGDIAAREGKGEGQDRGVGLRDTNHCV